LLQHKPDGLTKRASDMNRSDSGSYVEREGLRHHHHFSIDIDRARLEQTLRARADAGSAGLADCRKKAPGLNPGALAQTTGLELTD
jgi:hypothetical protein